MQLSLILILSANLLFSIDIAKAAYQMRPGLWETSFTIKSEDGKMENGMNRMQAEIDKMPADQRKMMEQMMAKNNVRMSGNATIAKVCISKEQAKNMEIPLKDNKNCTHQVVKRTPNSVKVKFACSGEVTTKGEGEFSLNSPTSYKGNTIVDSISHGKSERIDLNQKGKWLSAECGNVYAVESKK